MGTTETGRSIAGVGTLLQWEYCYPPQGRMVQVEFLDMGNSVAKMIEPWDSLFERRALVSSVELVQQAPARQAFVNEWQYDAVKSTLMVDDKPATLRQLVQLAVMFAVQEGPGMIIAPNSIILCGEKCGINFYGLRRCGTKYHIDGETLSPL